MHFWVEMCGSVLLMSWFAKTVLYMAGGALYLQVMILWVGNPYVDDFVSFSFDNSRVLALLHYENVW